MKPIRTAISTALLTALLPAAFAAQAESGYTALTIYSTAKPGALSPEFYRGGGNSQNVPGYAVVRHQRALQLNRGTNAVRFTDVAALIDPTTVSFESLTDPKGTSVIEQNFQFDLVNTQKLLEKYIDRRISVDQIRGSGVESFAGTLLSTSGGLVLKRDDGSIQTLPHNAGVRLPELPGGLITRPTLVWDIHSNRAGNHATRVSYQTTGITWWADYNLTYQEGANANACKLDVGAWVSIINKSGAGYSDAKLKLVAGDVHRAQPAGRAYPAGRAQRALAMEDRAKGFEEKEFFEYHLYTLGRPATIPNNSTKQIELFESASRVPAKKRLVYYGADLQGYYGAPMMDREFGPASNTKVDVWLTLRNDKTSGMGMPLPAGRIRVSQQDKADGSLEFVGEDKIDHTPKNEDVRVKLGTAFDVVGERRQTDFALNSKGRVMEEAFEIKIRNHKEQAVEVIVRENLYRWSQWTLLSQSMPSEKKDARTVEFPVRVAAGGEAVVTYRVRYTW